MSIKRQHVFSGSIYEEMAGYARAVIVGDHVYVSGTVGVDFETGRMPDAAADQTTLAVNTIEKALNDAGSGLQDIVRLRVFVPDAGDVMAVSSVLKSRIGFTHPANTTVCAPLAVEGARVEVEAEAIIGSGTADTTP